MEDSCIFSENSNYADDRLWSRQNVSALIEFMHDEVIKGNAVGHKFTTCQWVDLKEKMNARFPEKNYDVKKIQGKSDRLKLKWKKYHKLLLSDTGFGWDYENNMVVANDDTWARHLSLHKEDAPLRKKGLPHYRELSTIFSPTTATGSRARASTEQVQHHRDREPYYRHEESFGGKDCGEDEETPSPGGYVSSQHGPSASSTSRNSSKRKAQTPAVVSAMTSFTKANEAISKLVDNSQHDIETAMKCLHEMPDLPDAYFPLACQKLEDPTRRKMFLTMPECRRLGYITTLIESIGKA